MINLSYDPNRTRVTICQGCGESKPCQVIRVTGVEGTAFLGPHRICDDCRHWLSVQLAAVPFAKPTDRPIALTEREESALRMVEARPLTVSQLASQLNVSPRSAREILDRLEGLDLVREGERGALALFYRTETPA